MESNDTKLTYQGTPIRIEPDEEESRKHIQEDFIVLAHAGIDEIIRKQFVPWLKGEYYPDKEDDKVFAGLRVYSVTYHYGRIIAKYSPTKEEGYFGQFEFSFVSGDEYTAEMLEAAAMEVFVLHGRVVGFNAYDI